ncbi:MAG: hypothetical protein KR126chlam2_01134 [Chlamydiae bacterium]|nr:hypothetical protein [Chlamydiota bacterium]
MSCSCHSEKPYEKCCAPYHAGTLLPPTASALMRSRYSGYALGKVDYILDTTHPDHPDNRIPIAQRRKQIEAFCQQTRFEGLEILSSEDGEPYSYVIFRAILSQNGVDGSFTERSQFAKVKGRWLYLKGERPNVSHGSTRGDE